MPLLEATEQSLPRSALRYRPIGKDVHQQGSHPKAMAGITPVVKRASRLRPTDTEEGEAVGGGPRVAEDDAGAVLPHAPASSGLVGTPTRKVPKTPRLTRISGKRRSILRGHSLFYLGVGMIAMLALWTGLSMAISWGNTTWDDLHYGRPRVFQIDAVVGQNDSSASPSHFLSINLHSHIEILDFPGGDASRARIYMGPQLYGTDSDLAPVTLSFVDVSGRHFPDMIVHFQNTHLMFVNEQGGFRPARVDELPAIEQYLQQHGP